MNNFFNTNSKIMTVDEEQLKITTRIIKKYANDLDRIKKNADLLWEQCSVYLDDNILESINNIKESNNKKYTSAISELNNYANKMESIAIIWKDAEDEIKSSSRKLENLFSNMEKTMIDAINDSKK